MSSTDYTLSHRQGPPAVGLVVLAEDFGEGSDMSDQEMWQNLVEQASTAVKAARLLDADWPAGTLERADDALDEALSNPKVPPPPPPPPPPTGLSGVYGTYPSHGLAQDLYGGMTDKQVQWGPHHGLPLVAPADGRVEVYSFGTPLGHLAELWTSEYAANWHSLADGWVCRADPLQAMYVAVFWPSAPLVINGVRCGHLHYGHVRSDIKSGPVKKGEQFATTWDSGIRFEPGVPSARAAHVHCCAGEGTTLSPNGDRDGRLAVLAQGWSVTDIHSIPGPTDYQSGRYCAGRLLSDFTQGGHPVPPLPG